MTTLRNSALAFALLAGGALPGAPVLAAEADGGAAAAGRAATSDVSDPATSIAPNEPKSGGLYRAQRHRHASRPACPWRRDARAG